MLTSYVKEYVSLSGDRIEEDRWKSFFDLVRKISDSLVREKE